MLNLTYQIHEGIVIVDLFHVQQLIILYKIIGHKETLNVMHVKI